VCVTVPDVPNPCASSAIVPRKEDSRAGRFGIREQSRSMMRFKPKTATAFVLAGAALASGCGSGSGTHSTRTPSATAPPVAAHSATARAPAAATPPATAAPPAFAWLHPAPAPASWRLARLTGSAALAYPPSWRRIRSDPGTVSAALMTSGSGLITEYLNATPQQANETLANWSSFRLAHNREEGDSHEQVLGAARDLRFRNGRGSCVIDRYRTSRARYTEIACLVRAPSAETVVVAAGLSARWSREAPALERAVSAFLA
jgi:hypothetical protein